MLTFAGIFDYSNKHINRMKKRGFIPFILIAIIITAASCNKTTTYVEWLRQEQTAIDKFIADSGIVVLNEFLADTIFKPKEFYKDPQTGIYYNIVSRGVKTKAENGNLYYRKPEMYEEIYIRFSGRKYIKDNSIPLVNNLDSPYPEIMQFFGRPVSNDITQYYQNQSMCPGWILPLDAVGHLGVVKIIVPFTQGFTYDVNSGYNPIYYNYLEYRFQHHNDRNY